MSFDFDASSAQLLNKLDEILDVIKDIKDVLSKYDPSTLDKPLDNKTCYGSTEIKVTKPWDY
jgi:hypothetical protein